MNKTNNGESPLMTGESDNFYFCILNSQQQMIIEPKPKDLIHNLLKTILSFPQSNSGLLIN